MNTVDNYKSGFIAVVGRPNVGKSTLINQLIGQKIAIMADKPQTTRNKILCVLTLADAQLIFIDTPGIHKPRHKLGEYMVKAAEDTLGEVDAILFVTDVTEKPGPGERHILKLLAKVKTPVILIINKIDKVTREQVLPVIEQYRRDFAYRAVIPVSAINGINLADIVTEVKNYLKPGPQYYPEDMITDQPERLIIAELIREKVIHNTSEEVPHAIAVDTDEITSRANGDLYVRAIIYVERDSQKGIIIGAGGNKLKKIGQQARLDIEKLLGSRVFLDLWVKVKDDWRNREALIKSFGYK